MWKQTTQMHMGKPVKRTTLFDEVESKEVFHKNFLDYFDIFKAHHDRVITQYEQFLILKRQLTQVDATCQIDFAENYVCSFSQEITSAYYSKVQVMRFSISRLLMVLSNIRVSSSCLMRLLTRHKLFMPL